MKTLEKREDAIIAIGALILIAALVTSGIFYSSNRSITNNLNNEKLKSEMLLSEKLELEKEIENFRNQVNSLNGTNSGLDKLLSETKSKLSEKEAQLNRIGRENGNIKTLKKELAELSQIKKEFENQALALNETNKKLNSEKDELNRTIASLRKENKQLSSNFEILSSMTADDYLVETTKRKDRLTVVAKRAKKMTISFKVPNNMVENISFKIIKPDGKLVEGKDNGIVYAVLNSSHNDLTASISGGATKAFKNIEMTYEPKEKQKPGIYQIEMYNAEKYISTCNMKLR